jgi:LacI family transcriptional regulator
MLVKGTVTIKDIARESGISIATVSRVLNNSGYASEEVKEKVLAAAKKLNYQPNAIARSLKKHKTNTIGVIIPDISNSYFMKISKGIEDTVYKSGYTLLFGSGDENPEKELKMLQVLLEQRVDAIVLATSGVSNDMIKIIRNTTVPVILVDRTIGDISAEFDCIVEDNVEGAYLLTNYLIEKGYKEIGVVNGTLDVSTGEERYRGYQRALADNHLTENTAMVFNGHFTEEDGVQAVDYFLNLQQKPQAILSFNNAMTFGVILRLAQKGYKVPDDFVIASYGEVEAAQLLPDSRIITIEQSPYEMGKCAGEILLDRLERDIKGPVHKMFSPKLRIMG